jgi:predicted DNA binding CopG/RHH family protein
MSKTKTIPKFKSENKERNFWEKHDSSPYIDWSEARPVSMPNLKPSTKTISLTLPESLLDKIKVEADRRGMSCESLIEVWLREDVKASRQD